MRQVLVWIRDHKLSTAGLVLVVLGCVALVNLSRRVHHLKPRAALASAAASASADARLAAPRQAAEEPVARSASMRREFETAARYLDFIQAALGRPQEGGQFYALLARERCSDVQRRPGGAPEHTGSDAFHDAAVALVDDLEKRCAGVLQTHADAPTLYRLALEQRGGPDILLPADGRGIAAPASRATAEADIDAALQTGDRHAAAQALRANAGFLDVGISTGDREVDRRWREWAGEIVGCELEHGCVRGIEAALHCVRTGDCTHEDYRDVVVARVPDAQRVIFDTMLAGLRERAGPSRGGGQDKP